MYYDYRCRQHLAPEDCPGCQSAQITTFHLAYFVHFGLKLPKHVCDDEMDWRETMLSDFDKHSINRIGVEIIAKSYEIMESRVLALRKVFSLQGFCIKTLVAHRSHDLQNLNLPTQISDAIENFDQFGAFDIVDHMISRTPGNTIFRPFMFPSFLFRNFGRYFMSDI